MLAVYIHGLFLETSKLNEIQFCASILLHVKEIQNGKDILYATQSGHIAHQSMVVHPAHK